MTEKPPAKSPDKPRPTGRARATVSFVLLVSAAVISNAAQPDPSVRLGIVPKDSAVSAAGDVLTAELSKKGSLQLLDRGELDRVYREQALSAATRDYLKLGQILGADGLLLLESGEEGTNRFLRAQLVAVKPGVLLLSERFGSPIDLPQWASGFASHLTALLPKLSVPVQDAVPISVVNLRASVQSAEAREIERLLTLLAIERLSRERRLFVLERRNLQLLGAENDLKGLDDSAFWNSSYLLDGTLDRQGYSANTLTVSARLVPPRSGSPFAIEVSGSRSNLSEVVNRLADQVLDHLKLGTSTAPWKGPDEATQFFDDATWALKWGIIGQAQAGAESAWALGKQDRECGSLRIRSRLPEIR